MTARLQWREQRFHITNRASRAQPRLSVLLAPRHSRRIRALFKTFLCSEIKRTSPFALNIYRTEYAVASSMQNRNDHLRASGRERRQEVSRLTFAG